MLQIEDPVVAAARELWCGPALRQDVGAVVAGAFGCTNYPTCFCVSFATAEGPLYHGEGVTLEEAVSAAYGEWEEARAAARKAELEEEEEASSRSIYFDNHYRSACGPAYCRY